MIALLSLGLESIVWDDYEEYEDLIDDFVSSLIDKVQNGSDAPTGSNMIKISDNVPSGSNNYIDITLPTSGYSEFLVKIRGGSGTVNQRIAVAFNSDFNNANYVGLNQALASITNRNFLVGVENSGQQSRGELRIFNPHSATIDKTFWCDSSFSNDYLSFRGYWNNSSALTTLRLTSSTATVVTGYSAELWGLEA